MITAPRAAEPRELSPEEIDAVSGAWSVELFGFTVTGSDVASDPSGCGTSSSSWARPRWRCRALLPKPGPALVEAIEARRASLNSQFAEQLFDQSHLKH